MTVAWLSIRRLAAVKNFHFGDTWPETCCKYNRSTNLWRHFARRRNVGVTCGARRPNVQVCNKRGIQIKLSRSDDVISISLWSNNYNSYHSVSHTSIRSISSVRYTECQLSPSDNVRRLLLLVTTQYSRPCFTGGVFVGVNCVGCAR